MCGIAGMIAKREATVCEALLGRITDRLAHRGPDGFGVHVDGNGGLGHRRLAIIDLEGGKQPICNEDRSIWLTCNGEIYNYRELRNMLASRGHVFRTNSDSEVIVHAYEEWGVEALARLRGMFAFGIWDGRKRQLFLARDRMGIKPLCYYEDDAVFAFASEIQAFWELDPFDGSPDLEALDLYLHLQYIPAPYSIYARVRKLPPAHYMVVEADGTGHGPRRYWDLEFRPDYKVKSGEWIERLDAALREAVQSHLISDVPFGAFLSGGVDSSSIVAYMAETLEEPVRTFSIGFDDAACDERAYAREAAAMLGTLHQERVMHADALAVLDKLVQHHGEPFGDSSAICTYHVAQTAREHVKMVLTGDGGDETLAGYDYFAKMLLRHPEPSGWRQRWRRAAGRGLRRFGLRPAVPSPRETWYHRSPSFGPAERRKLWRPEFRQLLDSTRQWNDAQFEPVKDCDLLSQCLYVDSHNYLPFDNLCKVDTATMAHGLEARVPLLDHVLLETVSRIPPDLKIRFEPGVTLATFKAGGYSCKHVLKETTGRFFPKGFFDRQKKGFSVPLSSWLAGPSWGALRETVLDSRAALEDWFDMAHVERLMDGHRQGTDHGSRLWSLLFLAEWRRLCPGPAVSRVSS